ncbi:unnamed protein product [Ceutorhynchus assimilis]|uniref:Phosphoglycolate phosphatase n=1 Tax=Ceutorhynchus assimilis TaxID=467358 RepID=A0A9P0DC55_9CUCU|nr:unnamed protein product [Ceutorhynchus assimilis]
MSRLQWINELSEDEVQNIVESVDIVLFDVDGVLLHNRKVISGSDNAVMKLRKLGKIIGFVTNNTLKSLTDFTKALEPFGAKAEEIVNPTQTLLAYLKKIDFKQDIFGVCCNVLKECLRDEGYNVIDYQDIQKTPLQETFVAVKEMSYKTLEVCQNVGLVHVDSDFNRNYGTLQAAQIILNNNKDVILTSGARDDDLPIDEKLMGIGSKYFIDTLERFTGRQAIKMSKPDKEIRDMVISKFKITDSSRVLMVGDSILSDIAFGVASRFKTLLILSGILPQTQIAITDNQEIKPNFVAHGLEELYQKIINM